MNLFRFLRAVIVPACIYQSIAIAGATATGRDVVEYFTQYGPTGGTYGFIVVVVGLAILVALAYEFARLYQAYDYQSFAKHLVGPFWPCFELIVIVMLLLVLSVVAAAAGAMVHDSFGLPPVAGLLLLLGTIAVLAYFGREVLAKVMVFWTGILYLIFITYFVLALFAHEGNLSTTLLSGEVKEGWDYSALKFILYNSLLAPMMIYATRGIETRTQAYCAGALSVILAILPSFLFHFSFLGKYPDILNQPVPVHWMLSTFNMKWLVLAYLVVVLGTFIETGSGMVQMLNERIDNWSLKARGRKISPWLHSAIGIGILLCCAVLAQFGVIALIAKGYGTIGWAFLILYIIPLLTYGLYRILQNRQVEVGK